MTDRYTLIPAQSRFTVQAFATGLLSGFAHNPTFAVRDFGGELAFDPASPESATLRLTVKATSLELADRVSDKDRREIELAMREQVLDVARYPEIAFESTHVGPTRLADNWFRLQILGKLSLHGATNPQEIDAQLRLNDGELRLGGETTVLQSTYKIKLVSAAGGMIKVKDPLKFAFDLFARTAEAAG